MNAVYELLYREAQFWQMGKHGVEVTVCRWRAPEAPDSPGHLVTTSLVTVNDKVQTDVMTVARATFGEGATVLRAAIAKFDELVANHPAREA